MKDLRINFDGQDGTYIDLKDSVEGKRLYEQKFLVNLATSKNTDIVYEDRGTNLLVGAIGGVFISSISTQHLINFSTTDTLYFCSYEEHADIYESDEYINGLAIDTVSYNNSTNCLVIGVTFSFKDDTTTLSNAFITSNA